MTFSNAITLMRDGQGTKTPTMGGYVYRNDVTGESEPGTGYSAHYTLSFIERKDVSPSGGTGDSQTIYSFDVKVKTGGGFVVTKAANTPKTPITGDTEPVANTNDLVLDPMLLSYMMSSDWEVYDQDVLESARTATDSRW